MQKLSHKTYPLLRIREIETTCNHFCATMKLSKKPIYSSPHLHWKYLTIRLRVELHHGLIKIIGQ